MAHISRFSRDILQWRGAPLIRRLHPPSRGRGGGGGGGQRGEAARSKRLTDTGTWRRGTTSLPWGGIKPLCDLCSRVLGSGRSQSRAETTSLLSLLSLPHSPPHTPSPESTSCPNHYHENRPVSGSASQDALRETFRYVNNWMEIVYDVLNSTSMNKVEHLFMCPRVICISYSVSSLFINFANIKYYIKYWSLCFYIWYGHISLPRCLLRVCCITLLFQNFVLTILACVFAYINFRIRLSIFHIRSCCCLCWDCSKYYR